MGRTKAVCAIPSVAYRIERDGQTLAIVLAMSNRTWALFDAEERERLSKMNFAKVSAALRAYLRRHPEPRDG